MSNSGETSETCGNIAISSETPTSRPLPGKSSRLIAYAAIVPSTTAISVAMSAMPIELTRARTNWSVWKIGPVVVQGPLARDEVAVGQRGRSS